MVPIFLRKLILLKSPLEYLYHIRDEAEFILNSTKDIDKESFLADPVLTRAIIRSLEIVGEAAKKVPKEYKESVQCIEWKSMARMRDKLIHHYFGIDYSIVWDVVSSEIAPLYKNIILLIEKINKDNSSV